MPFSIHQVAEYVLGLGLIAQAVQGSQAIAPVLLGAAILASAAVTDGPVAGWKAVSRPVHRVVDIVLAVVALALAVLPWSAADLTSRAVLVVTAALLGLLILRTDYAPKTVREPRSRGDVAEDFGRSAGRLVGRRVKAYRDRRTGPDSPGSPPSGPSG
jgi:hypothetical protein